MPKFRSKERVTEANQFQHAATAPVGVRSEEDGRCYVVTAHDQKVYLEPGDWIVPEPDGRGYYPIKPDIFEKNWEPEGLRAPLAPVWKLWYALGVMIEARRRLSIDFQTIDIKVDDISGAIEVTAQNLLTNQRSMLKFTGVADAYKHFLSSTKGWW